MSKRLLTSPQIPIIVMDDNSGRRSMLVAAIKSLGYIDITSAASGRETLNAMADKEIGWIIGSYSDDETPNILQILSLTHHNKDFRPIMVSVFIPSNITSLLPKAFELGLLSWHSIEVSSDGIKSNLNEVIKLFEKNKGETREVAAHYLRQYLLESRGFKTLVQLEESMANVNSGSSSHYFDLAKAEILALDYESGIRRLRQLEVCFPEMRDQIDKFAKVHASDHWTQSSANTLLFDDRLTHIVCNDSATTEKFKATLNALGIKSVQSFAEGKTYVDKVKSTKQIPQLFIFDWGITDIENVVLVQRVQTIDGFPENILIFSDFVDPGKDKVVLKELGLFGSISSPINTETLGKELLRLTRELHFPKNSDSLEFKMRRALQKGQTKIAVDIYKAARGNPQVSESAKIFMHAQLDFAHGLHAKAAKMMIDGMRKFGDSIASLNFLGKCMLALGKFDSAVACFSKANEMAPGSIERLCGLSMAKFENKDRPGATKALNDAKVIDPNNPDVIVTEAIHDLRDDKVDRARLMLKRLNSHLGIGANLNNTAVANIRCQRIDEALKLYAAARAAIPDELTPARLVIQYNHALALGRLNSNLDKIPDLLTEVTTQAPSESLRKKAGSLLKRVNMTIATGAPLHIKPIDSGGGDDSKDQNLDIDIHDLPLGNPAVNMPSQDKCLIGSFVFRGILDVSARQHFENIPKIKSTKSGS
jgi:tetratricopeptide (TPR) repeat protein